jgi:aldose 1-epimerase
VGGKIIYLFTLKNSSGSEVSISNYGSTITRWLTQDKQGLKSSIVLGFDSLSGYLSKPPYFGATIGRYGNRIAKGEFKIGERTYHLAKNNGPNSLHGGLRGFDKVVWDPSPINDSLPSLTLNYGSKDGEEGYPGNLLVSVTFTLTEENEFRIEYSAHSDQTTPVNLTNHSYFNLSGDPSRNILGERLWIDANYYTPVDSTLIPTGKIDPVKDTPFDFTKPEQIGARIGEVPGGYDHNFVLNRKDSLLQLVARLSDSVSGRFLEVYTTEPGLQFYSGNFLDGRIKTSEGKPIGQHAALCLETQHFPDSPNEPGFPSSLLNPGDAYHTVTVYKAALAK